MSCYPVAVLIDGRVVLRAWRDGALALDTPISTRRAVILAHDLLHAALIADATGGDALLSQPPLQGRVADIVSHTPECRCQCVDEPVAWGEARWGKNVRLG